MNPVRPIGYSGSKWKTVRDINYLRGGLTG